MMKLRIPKVTSVLIGALMGLSVLADSTAEGTMDLERPITPPSMANFGSIPGNRQVTTNFTQVIDDLVYNIVRKQDRFLIGANLDTSDVYYKLTLASSSTEDGVAPTLEYLYASQLGEGAAIYGPNMKRLSDFDGAKGWRYIVNDEGTPLMESINSRGNVDYWTFTTSPVTGAVIKAVWTPPSSYDFSHPQDWRIVWRALDDPDTSIVDTETPTTNHAGQIKTEYTVNVIKNNKAELGIQYFDEVNLPNFTFQGFEVVDGPGSIEGNTLTATESGVVTVRGTASNGQSRSCPVSMYQWISSSGYSNYSGDVLPERDRINDYHLSKLQAFRANPTTNRYYTTWNSPESTKHYGNPADTFTGEYGRQFFPYQHTTANSGGDASFWWSHGIISKHVVLAAAHYGWNHNRILNGYAYVNWDGKFSGKLQVKYKKYTNLSEWASSNGFEGSDAQCGDLGVFLIETIGNDNAGIPDECLPYLATADYLNSTYKRAGNITDYIPVITLNQANMIGLRCGWGSDWSNWGNVACEGIKIYEDGIIRDEKYRSDLYDYVRKGGWHSPIMGDSGKPVFLYDPALTTGQTYDFNDGNGPVPLLRPILLACHTSVGAGTSVSRMIKVIKAYVESEGDTLQYVLGDPDKQTTSYQEVKINADMTAGIITEDEANKRKAEL